MGGTCRFCGSSGAAGMLSLGNVCTDPDCQVGVKVSTALNTYIHIPPAFVDTCLYTGVNMNMCVIPFVHQCPPIIRVTIEPQISSSEVQNLYQR